MDSGSISHEVSVSVYKVLQHYHMLDAHIISSQESGATGEQFAHSIRWSMYNVIHVRQLNINCWAGQFYKTYTDFR